MLVLKPAVESDSFDKAARVKRDAMPAGANFLGRYKQNTRRVYSRCSKRGKTLSAIVARAECRHHQNTSFQLPFRLVAAYKSTKLLLLYARGVMRRALYNDTLLRSSNSSVQYININNCSCPPLIASTTLSLP